MASETVLIWSMAAARFKDLAVLKQRSHDEGQQRAIERHLAVPGTRVHALPNGKRAAAQMTVREDSENEEEERELARSGGE